MLVSYEHLFLEIFLRTCLYYAKLCTHFKSHSHKRARTLQRGLVFRQFKLFCLQTASSIDFGQIVEPVNCMTGPSLIVIYLGFRYTDEDAWHVLSSHRHTPVAFYHYSELVLIVIINNFWQWRCLNLHRASPCAISDWVGHATKWAMSSHFQLTVSTKDKSFVQFSVYLKQILLPFECYSLIIIFLATSVDVVLIQTASIVYFDLFVDHRTLPALALPFNKHKFRSPLNATPWLVSSWSQVFLHRK